MIALFFQIFWCFFIIGLFTFGGGYAVVSLIHGEVVAERAWIPEGTFTDILAISQVTPGPIGLNCSTYVGYEVLRNAGAGQLVCVLGSFAASLAVILPSFLIMLAIVRFYTRFNDNRIFKGTMSYLKPAVAGLIGAAAFALMFNLSLDSGLPQIEVIRESFPEWKSWLIFAATIAAYLWLKAGPVTLLIAGALAGLLIF